MSTNYYLDRAHNEAGHIGQWTNGHFIAKAPAGIDTFEAWVEMLQGHTIVSEHGIQHTPAEMLAEIEPTLEGRRSSRSPHYDEGEFKSRGVLFVRHNFC